MYFIAVYVVKKLDLLQSAGVTPEVNLRNSMQARKHASEKSTLALKPRADVTRNPKRVSVAPRKGLMSSNNLKKKLDQQEKVMSAYVQFKTF